MNILNKYRPSKLSEVIGNAAAVRSVENIISSETKPHTFLFHGLAGTGKTTLARILANKLGAVDMDVMEIQLRGIETAEDVKDTLILAPQGQSKAYILDEVQHLTAAAQNALLKPLEEPPNKTYFILCTTDPGKLIRPIKSRCRIIKTVPLLAKEGISLVNRLCEIENVKLEAKFKDWLVRASERIPRDIIVNFDATKNAKTKEEFLSLLHYAPENDPNLAQLARSLKDGSWDEITTCLERTKGIEPEKIRIMLCNWYKTILLNSHITEYIKVNLDILNCFKEPYYNEPTAYSCLVRDCAKAYLSLPEPLRGPNG